MNYFKLKFLLLFFALAVALPPAWAGEVTDVLTLSTFGVTGTTYTDVSGKKATSDAVYAGNLAGGNDAIQLRSDNTSGIITTESGGKVKSIKITFNSHTAAGRIVNVYGKSSAYTAASELYTIPTRGDAIGSFNIDAGNTGTITIPEGKEYSYIGIKSSSNAIYLDKIEIVWETEGGGETPVKQDLTTFAFSSATASATLGQAFTAPTLTVNPTVDVTDVTYSSSDPDVATVANDGTVTLVGAGTTTITASFAGNDAYNAATASYTLTVNAAQPTGLITDFYESFDQTNGTGGNDGSWSGNNIASNNITTDKQGWTFENEGGAYQCIKLGAGSKKGSATTPSITVTPGITYTLTFKAGAWSGDKTTLNLSATGGDLSATSVTMTSADWQAYSITFTATDETARIKFEGFQATKARFFLDEVSLTHDQNATPVTVVAKPEFSVAGGNYTEAQSVEISCATEGATIYYTIDGTDPTEESTPYTGAISINKTTTLKAIAVKDGQSSAVAEATYTIKTVTSVANLQAANALDDDTEFIYTGEAVVVWRDGNQMWLQDPNATATEGGGALVYGNVVSSFSSKDKLKSGWTAKKGTYNNASQFTELSAEKDGYQEASPFERTSINTDNVHEYVLLKGVSISSDKKSLTFPGENGSTLTVYDKFKKLPSTINATSTYDIDGIIVLFGGNTLEIYPLGYEEHPAAVVEVKAPEFTYNNEAITGSSVEVNANDKITITSEEGTTLRYTTDGSNPIESTTALLTDGNTAEVTITEACTIKAVARDGDANESEVATLAVTISEPAAPLANEFVLVTDINQLAHGKQIIFVSTNTKNDYADAMSSQQYSNNRGVETVAVTENKTVTLNDNGTSPYSTEIFTLEKDGDYWYFKANKTSGYIYAAGGTSNNYLKTSETKIDNAQATISIDGKAIVTFNVSGTGARNLLSYNPNNSPAIYSCYKAEQKPVYIYVEKGDTPEPEPLAVTLPEVPAEHYKVGQEVKVKATVENGSENTKLTYKVGEETLTPDNEGNVTLPNKKAGDVVLNVKATDGDRTANDSKTYVFDAAEALTITLNPANGEYYVGAEAKVNVTVDKAITTNPTITYKFGEEGEAQTYNAENGIVLPTAEAGTINLTVTVDDNGYEHTGENTATGTYTVKAKEVVTLTFDKENVELYAGQKFTAPTLSGLPEGATVTYTVTNTDPEVEVAKVENNVVVLTGNAGTATVTATYAGDASHNSATATYTITVKAKKEAGLAFDPTTATAEAGAEEFTAPTLVNPNNLSPITYKSSDENVAAFVDGVLVIGDAGETTITATFAGNEEFNEGSASYTLTVTKKDAGLKYEQAELTVYAGNDFTAPTLVNPNKLSPITYSSDNEKVAMVDDKTGEVVLMDEIGNATITATFAGNGQYNEATASYTIHVIAKKTATLTFDPTQVTVYVGTEEITQPTLTTNPNNLSPITYSSGNDNVAMVDDKTGEVVLMGEIGNAKITATFAGNDEYAKAEASYTVTVEPRPIVVADKVVEFELYVGQTGTKTFTVMAENLKGDITLTLSDKTGFYSIEPTTIDMDDAENATVTVTYAPTTEGFHEATVTLSTMDAEEDVTVTLNGTATVPEVVAMPTFSLVAGSYTGPQQVTINCATKGATISYSTDGGKTWTVGNTVYVDKDMTIMAKAEKDGYTISETATGYYVIDIPEALPTDMPTFDGYYSVLNSGKYANIQGRKTLTFTDAPDAQAGTVIRLKSDNTGKVEVLRSQAADLQRYAYRAMDYVPDIVQIVVDKLGAEGEGHILGKDGLDAIMKKFDESFKPDLYIEKAGDNGYRIYGRTPSMQPVVDFYRENKDKVEAKLPDLVAFINSALAKLRNKANQAGMDGDNVFVDFDLKTIWTRMGGNLTDPEVDEMGFYRDVLNYKDNVWNFAYQTATFYLEKIKNTGTYTSLSEQLGEFAQYLDKIDQIHPDFKYYIVANEEVTKPDFISQGNADIIKNAARTIWTIKERPNFTVNFPAENKYGNEYVTTLYTDFAYTLPKGVTAYAVTEVSTQGVATLTALEGTIPAQTPVLLKSTAAGPQTVTLSTEAGTAPADNLLVGPDYLIKHYKFKTPQVVDIFNYIKDELPGFYDEYVAQYEYLMLKTAGTVGNKYFWDVNSDLAGLKDDCIVRSLAVDENGTLAFSDHWTTETNKAFLVDDASNPQDVIKLPSLRGDINKDGVISITDVTALIDILLDLPARTYLESTDTYPKGLDYEAADVNENKDIEITDVTTLIDILLNMPDQPAQGSGN